MKKLLHLIILLPVFFASFVLNAQQPGSDVYTDVALFKDSILLNNCMVFIDSNNNISPIETLEQKWIPLSAYKIKTHIPPDWITKRVYLKLHIANSSVANDSLYFLPGISFSSIKVFEVLSNNRLKQVNDQSQSSGFQPLVITANGKQPFIAELYFTKYLFSYLAPQLIKNGYLDKYKKM